MIEWAAAIGGFILGCVIELVRARRARENEWARYVHVGVGDE